MSFSDRVAARPRRPLYMSATLLLLVASAASHAQQMAPLHTEFCQLDSNPEQIWPTLREQSALASASASNGAVAEYVAHQHREVAPSRPTAAERASRVEWEDARRMILRGYVVAIEQDHQGGILLTTDRGNVFKTIEPKIDNVFVVASVVDPCHRFIKIITE